MGALSEFDGRGVVFHGRSAIHAGVLCLFYLPCPKIGEA